MTATLSVPVAPSRTTSFTPPIATAADALRARGFGVVIAHAADAARRAVLDLLPDGAAVNTGASATLTALGITDAIQDARRLTAVRPLVATMDRATQADEIRRMLAAPDIMLASAAAVTQDGRVLLASGSGSQIGPIASGAGRVVLVIGAQKVVPDLDAAFDRLHETVFPLENARAKAAYGTGASINQTLVLHAGGRGRITVVLVTESVGF
jgi:hypothetical protein